MEGGSGKWIPFCFPEVIRFRDKGYVERLSGHQLNTVAIRIEDDALIEVVAGDAGLTNDPEPVGPELGGDLVNFFTGTHIHGKVNNAGGLF